MVTGAENTRPNFLMFDSLVKLPEREFFDRALKHGPLELDVRLSERGRFYCKYMCSREAHVHVENPPIAKDVFRGIWLKLLRDGVWRHAHGCAASYTLGAIPEFEKLSR